MCHPTQARIGRAIHLIATATPIQAAARVDAMDQQCYHRDVSQCEQCLKINWCRPDCRQCRHHPLGQRRINRGEGLVLNRSPQPVPQRFEDHGVRRMEIRVPSRQQNPPLPCVAENIITRCMEE